MKTLAPPELDGEDAIKVGYLRDYISNTVVKATPEEVDAVQVFSRRLVEDYGYPAHQVHTRPQFRVRRSPSDEGGTYPVDICVFNSKSKIENNLYIVVECKKKNRKDGLAQLKLYLDMSPAEIGVWFNGDDHIYLRKVHKKGAGRDYVEIPNIPRYGQRVEDIGKYSRQDLRAPSNLKSVFRDIRNHLAGMTTGLTRDEALAQEIINLLFCKILDEQETDLEDAVSFRASVDEKPSSVRKRIDSLFADVKNRAYGDVFKESDVINLDNDSIVYIVGELQTYCIMDADRDAIGDAFEVFIGPALRGAEGQFFTPRNVVKMIIEILDPKPGDKIIDPACGSGGFLITALEYVWDDLRKQAKKQKWKESQLAKREVQVATDCFRGIDKDGFLSKVCKAYMALIGDGRGGVFCENSLNNPKDWSIEARARIKLASFDIVVTNPPFGSKIPIKGSQILSQYDLGHKWKRDKKKGVATRLNELEAQRAPQTLFLERCLQLLKPDGKMGIVLPESIVSNPSYQYVLEYLQSRATIVGIVTMPESLFKTSGKGGTHTKVAVLFIKNTVSDKKTDIFMSDVKWCGHDSRGNPTLRKDDVTGLMTLLDEVPAVPGRFRDLVLGDSAERDHLGYLIGSDKIKNSIMVPKYYDPEIDAAIKKLKSSHDFYTVGELVKQGFLSLATGVEPGKMAYGTGAIPFIRTSDLSNWELKADFKHGVSKAIYEEYSAGSLVAANDILMVRDGTYLIGTCAMVTEFDLPMLYQSHLIRIRVNKNSPLDAWLLFGCLNTPIVKRQIKSKQFTQDIIDTLGTRLSEVMIPVPKDIERRKEIGREVKSIVTSRAEMRNRAKILSLGIQGIKKPKDDDMEVLEDL